MPEKCPVCHLPKTVFKEKEDALKTAQDKATVGESEKKHIPAITIVRQCGLIPDGCIDAHVRVGEILHPMLPEHSIGWIDFYLDKKFISRVQLMPGVLNPAAVLHLKANAGTLSVVENCNIHGSWINEAVL
jgi:superoxide reductase